MIFTPDDLKHPYDDVIVLVVATVSASLLWLASMFSWLFCCCWCSAVAGIHPVASIPALAGVPEITGVPAVATIPAVTDNQ
jgi:hypothetical protein